MRGKWTSKWEKALGQKNTEKCPNCGLDVPVAFNFCPECGRTLK